MASTSSSMRSSRSDHNSSIPRASTSSSMRSSRSDHNSSIYMGSTSSSMRSSRSDHTRFSVFLSFRGEDTRHSFTDHLYAALKRAAINAFRDNEEIERGRDLLPEIVKAIENSRASVVVLSKNYAKSSWCLEELSLILEQKKKYNHFVLPVFYHVDPSDVRNQQRKFAIKVREEIEGTKWTEENVNRWKLALREVADLTGMVASGSETEFIAKIVDKIDCELDLKLVSTPAYLIGMENRAKDINSWLRNEHSSTTNVLAICGMGGGGKTTLAQYIYNSNKHNFESSCFLEEVGKHFKEAYGVLGLQKQLLTDILGGKEKIISGVSEGTTMINNVLHMKKVLIVLDDIDEFDQLEILLGINSNDTQSKIIVTTRRLDIHLGFEKLSWRCHVHQVKLLNDLESFKVLSYHAFNSEFPLQCVWDLSVQMAEFCGGNPLALKVLGSSLIVGAEDPRERNSIEETWKSRLNSLCPVRGDVDRNIQSVLKKSFDSLPLACYRELFLHIVVFFIGEDEDYVVKIMENDWHAKDGIRMLINRCLLTVSPYKKLMMHQLLQDMGRNIIREESIDHARVWCNDEAYRVLIKGDDSETIEGLTLDTRFIPKGTKVSSIKTSSLAKLHKLKLLRLKYVILVGDYKNIPELRWLCWHGCHLKTIPSGLLRSTLLVAIDMTNGDLEKFEPPMELNSLKVLNLTSCYNLVSICKFCRLPNLQTLILWCCTNLTHICKTIEGLENLSLLNLAQCKALWKASWGKKLLNQPLFSFPHSLKFLFLHGGNPMYPLELCFSFNGPLYGMNLSCNLFESIPRNIDLSVLRVLNLTSCKWLKSIMNLPSTLEELYTYNCISLEKVAFQSTRFSLRKFDYRGCFRLSEVQGLFKLATIEELDEVDLRHMKRIKEYQDHKLDMVGDEITKGRIWHFQVVSIIS
ncbi:disease resistance protein RUN1-like [Helianthus annuus]|uniref:disease resistance protein RUN1-like n=1 Tax=Helianthus annuus TaxID=4232 RepID=UPI00165340B1|nr:disease resistance protein RUN1-like [Helianthus annuus]